MDLHHGYQPGIMHFDAGNSDPDDQSSPLPIDHRGIRREWKEGLEPGQFLFSVSR